MAIKKKMLQAAAGVGGAGPDITDVFSTYLYTGTGVAQTVTNGVDLAGEGGLVWTKARILDPHILYDTARGVTVRLSTNDTGAQTTDTDEVTAFNSDGHTLGTGGSTNGTGTNYASWTFRKAPKFFDVVTYTGTGAAQNISHNLGSVPGMIIVKQTNGIRDWPVYHRGIDATNPSHYKIPLNKTEARANELNIWNDTEPTSTHFTVGSDGETGGIGDTYVAYLFAHNDGDGDFGPDADQDIIKCGSYTGNGGANGPEIDLGFEPQWILVKQSSALGENWEMFDVMRGWINGAGVLDQRLQANSNGVEAATTFGHPAGMLAISGCKIDSAAAAHNASGATYIYMAIRRGPLAPPEAATDVFAIDVRDDTDAPQYKSGFVTDFSLYRDKAAVDDWRVTSRLQGTGGTFPSITTAAESAVYTDSSWDWMNGFHEAGTINTGYLSWMWKRAPGFMDVVAYSGNSVAGQAVIHRLGVAPEMMWVKSRGAVDNWAVYHKGLNGGTTPENYYLNLDTTAAGAALVGYWNNTAPTASNFTVGTNPRVNDSAGTYMAYLFATVAGVSKVGSYTGDGTTGLTIDCGFTAGARFVLIKRTDAVGDWFTWDSVRGIIAGNDPHLSLNTTAAEVTTNDSIDPVSSGFAVNQLAATNINVSAATYIFYAVA